MMLTLRTLLAWLDDTLSIDQCRQLGRLVEESPIALRLVVQIFEAMRNDQTTNSMDPSLIADYLDNQLTPTAVTQAEQIFLNESAALGEVAECHYILSRLGEKIRISVEIKSRMYKLAEKTARRSSTG